MNTSALSDAWPLKQLKDVASGSGLFVDGDWIETKDQDPNGAIRLVQLADIGDGYFVNKSRRFLTKESAIRLKCTFLSQGDVLIARMPDPIGRACRLPDIGAVSVTAVDVSVLRPNDEWDPDYVVAAINDKNFRKEVMRATGGSTRARISRGNLGKLMLPQPPIESQRKIAELSSLFMTQRSGIDDLIKKKRLFKDSLASLLLTGRVRHSKFSGKNWHSSPLQAHVDAVVRKNVNGSQLVLTASGEHGLVDQRRYFSRNVAGADLSKYYLLKKGEFAYNRSAMTGYPYGATKRLDEHDEGILSTLYLCFGISDKNLDSDFLKHVFESGVLNRQLRPIVRVGARSHGLLNVSEEDFFSISIPFPELEEQRKIAHVLNNLDEEIELMHAQREKFDHYRGNLISSLLSRKSNLLR